MGDSEAWSILSHEKREDKADFLVEKRVYWDVKISLAKRMLLEREQKKDKKRREESALSSPFRRVRYAAFGKIDGREFNRDLMLPRKGTARETTL